MGKNIFTGGGYFGRVGLLTCMNSIEMLSLAVTKNSESISKVSESIDLVCSSVGVLREIVKVQNVRIEELERKVKVLENVGRIIG